MTEQMFIYHFSKLVDELDVNYLRGHIIVDEISEIEKLCKEYLRKKEMIRRKFNPLNGSD